MKKFLKVLKYIGVTLGILIALAVALLYIFDYDYILKGVRVVYMTGHKTAFIDDYTYFDNAVIEKGNAITTWKLHKDYNTVSATAELQEVNESLGTVAFLVIKNDSIWYEKYAEGYGKTSKTNSFSMAKSLVSLMLGKAIEDGLIKSLDQPIGDFLPEFSEGLAAKTTVGDLSSMSSGLDWTEHYTSPFSITARAYYDPNLREVMNSLKIIDQPGKSYKYLSGNTQLLAMVLEEATGVPLSQYFSRNFWKPMGMEQEGLWQLDSDKNHMEKAYCCVASNARDFARFGVMINNKGFFNGKQILPESFITLATQPRFQESPQYGYGFWLSDHLGKDISAMRGILGQYVISIPEDDLVIVRLGHSRGAFDGDRPFTKDFYVYLEEVYTMLSDAQEN